MVLRIRFVCFAILLSFVPVMGQAAVVETGSEIDAVTVFPDRAEVTRVAELSLPAGANTVVLADLPASLIETSVRVRGTGGGFEIGSVETRKIFAESMVQEEERRLAAEIEALQDRRRGLVDRIAAFKVQLEFIAAIGKEAPKTANEEISRGRMDPEAWQKAWGFLGSGVAEALEGIRTAEFEQRDLDRKIEQRQHSLSQIRTGLSASIIARVNLDLPAAATVRLALSYQLPGASWRPLYDARLDSEASEISLTQLGEVRQRTGEDWTAVALTLSTARPAVSAQVPDLDTWFVDFGRARAFGGLSSESLERGVADEFRDQNKTVAEAPAPLAEPEESKAKVATLRASAFAAEYVISGVANVPSDNQAHKFTIAERSMAARLAARIVPKVTAQAYIQAEVEYQGEEPLLPGTVTVFRDNAFVGTSRMDLLRPGETHGFSFGVDDKVSVDYRLVEGERSRQGLINKDRRVERRYRTEIANRHDREIEITLVDNLPVPRDERIEVELLPDTTKPSVTDLEERKGVFAWTKSYAPGETGEVRFGYAVTYPEDQDLLGF